jgi:pseudaminic acid synthase
VRDQIVEVGNYKIGSNHKPFIIAEMSGNHNQSIEKALKLVDAAAEAGVQALKLQTYTADTMTIDLSENEFYISDANSPWKGNSLYELYGQAFTPWEWHEEIFKRCSEKGIIGFSTPFDATSVNFLESLNVPIYKIASFENTDIPLIKMVASTGKPMIISTGMATVEELGLSVRTAKENGCKNIILLKCTSNYPASPANTNTITIPHMEQLFDVQVGLSDHTMGNGVACAAVALGATVVEKHFTLSRADGGVDSTFSLEPHELKNLVLETERAWQSKGKVSYGPTESEMKSMVYRRSLYITEDMKAGEILSSSTYGQLDLVKVCLQNSMIS